MQENSKKPQEEKPVEMSADKMNTQWKHKHFVAGLPMIEVTLENGQKNLA